MEIRAALAVAPSDRFEIRIKQDAQSIVENRKIRELAVRHDLDEAKLNDGIGWEASPSSLSPDVFAKMADSTGKITRASLLSFEKPNDLEKLVPELQSSRPADTFQLPKRYQRDTVVGARQDGSGQVHLTTIRTMLGGRTIVRQDVQDPSLFQLFALPQIMGEVAVDGRARGEFSNADGIQASAVANRLSVVSNGFSKLSDENVQTLTQHAQRTVSLYPDLTSQGVLTRLGRDLNGDNQLTGDEIGQEIPAHLKLSADQLKTLAGDDEAISPEEALSYLLAHDKGIDTSLLDIRYVPAAN